MEKNIATSKLYKLLEVLGAKDWNAFERFLDSPYFNPRADVKQLAKTLKTHIQERTPPEKTEVWQQLNPHTPYNDKAMRLLMSYLTRLLEQFMAVEIGLTDAVGMKMKAAAFLRARNPAEGYEQMLESAGEQLEKQTLRNADHLLLLYQQRAESYRLAFANNPASPQHAAGLNQTLDLAFLAIKLRQTMWLLNHEQVYNIALRKSKLDAFIDTLTEADYQHEPALLLYHYSIKLLQNPEEEAHFQQFTTYLLANGRLFPEEETRDLYILAINFAVRQVNDGRRSYFDNMMELYKAGLQQGYLLRNGQLSRFTYHNIVSTALQTGGIEWAKNFVETWTDKLEKPYRERMYAFSRAKIAYTGAEYEEALSFLQQSNYHDTLLNLGARTLLLKIYYELDEWDVLQSHLDAFQNYLRRKPDLGYHRTNYQNLILFTRKLLQVNLNSKQQRSNLADRIRKEKILTEKNWLLERLRQ